MDKTFSTVVFKEINDYRAKEGARPQIRHHHFLKMLRRYEEVLSNMGMIETLKVKVDGHKVKNFILTKDCIKFLVDITIDSDKVPLQKIYEAMGGEYKKLNYVNRFEDEFMKKITEALNVLGLTVNREYKVLNYLVDGYIPEVNLAIEYDEEYHSTPKQRRNDEERQYEIEKELNCSFIRLNYKDTDATNIGIVIKEIMKLKNNNINGVD